MSKQIAKIQVTLNEDIKCFIIGYSLTNKLDLFNYKKARDVLSSFFEPSKYLALIKCHDEKCHKITSCMANNESSIDILSTWILRHVHTAGKIYEVQTIEFDGKLHAIQDTKSETAEDTTLLGDVQPLMQCT